MSFRFAFVLIIAAIIINGCIEKIKLQEETPIPALAITPTQTAAIAQTTNPSPGPLWGRVTPQLQISITPAGKFTFKGKVVTIKVMDDKKNLIEGARIGYVYSSENNSVVDIIIKNNSIVNSINIGTTDAQGIFQYNFTEDYGKYWVCAEKEGYYPAVDFLYVGPQAMG